MEIKQKPQFILSLISPPWKISCREANERPRGGNLPSLPDNSSKGFLYNYSISGVSRRDLWVRQMKPTRSGMSLKGSAIHVVGFSVRLHRHQECPELSATSRALTTRRPHVELGTPRSQDHCNFSGPSAKIVANKRCLITKITSSTRERKREDMELSFFGWGFMPHEALTRNASFDQIQSSALIEQESSLTYSRSFFLLVVQL